MKYVSAIELCMPRVQLLTEILCGLFNTGDEPPFTQPYSLFSSADDYSESHHSEKLEQEMIDLITLQRLLSLAADDTPSKVRNKSVVCVKHICCLRKEFHRYV